MILHGLSEITFGPVESRENYRYKCYALMCRTSKPDPEVAHGGAGQVAAPRSIKAQNSELDHHDAA